MDGYTTAKEIRKNGFKGTLIALTGYSLDETKQQAAEAGFDHYLVKPVGFTDLKAVLPPL